ncbi:MAG: hypothetical protein ACOX2Q_05035 [Dehalobacterium sp.]|jgi:hypothetical protein
MNFSLFDFWRLKVCCGMVGANFCCGVLILFPLCVTVAAGIIAPISVSLIGLLMFGNLIRVPGRSAR